MTNTNTEQTNWYQNLIENIQGLALVGTVVGSMALLYHFDPTPHHYQQQLIVLTQALQIEQHQNPANAQAIANQFGGMSNLEQAVSNYSNMSHINVNHPSVPNLNHGNVHLDSLVSGTNNGEAIVNVNYSTYSMQPIGGTMGLVDEPVTNHHTMAIGQSSINLALQQAPSNNVKGGN